MNSWQQLFVALVTVLSVPVMGLINLLVNRRHHRETLVKVEQIHVDINSRMSELLALTRVEAEARGRLAERAEGERSGMTRVYMKIVLSMKFRAVDVDFGTASRTWYFGLPPIVVIAAGLFASGQTLFTVEDRGVGCQGYLVSEDSIPAGELRSMSEVR